jgi:hypothetical protein
MVFVQVDIPEVENKKLEVYAAYAGVSKQDALILILKGLDLGKVREEYFEGEAYG